MKVHNTYWVFLLGLFLSFSLAQPFCCHSNMIASPAHDHQEMPTHAAHDSHADMDTKHQKCNCGHELSKDYQKTKTSVKSKTLVYSWNAVKFNLASFQFQTNIWLTFFKLKPDILDDSSPPLHLLNSVFLN